MATNAFRQRFDEQLQCPVCLDQYSEPKILSCHHTFCLKCLENIKPKTEKKKFIKCPSCCTRTQLPKGGPKQLPNDFRMNSLMDLKLEDEEEVVEADAEPAEEHLSCPIHEDQEFKFFCVTCQELACPDCVVIGGEHKDHSYMHISDCYNEQLREIDSSLKHVQKKIVGLEKAKLFLDQTEEDILALGQVIQEEIHKHTLNQIKKIQESEAKLQDELKEIIQRKISSLASQREKADESLEQLRACVSIIEETLEMRVQDCTLVLSKKREIMEQTMIASRCQPATFVPIEQPNMGLVKKYPDSNIGTISSTELGKISLSPLNPSYLAKELVKATLQLESKRNELFIIKPSPVSCYVNTPDSSDCACEISNISSNYTISFLPVVNGTYYLVVKVGGIAIPGSPFRFYVAQTPQMKAKRLLSHIKMPLYQPKNIAIFANGNILITEMYYYVRMSIITRKEVQGETYSSIKDLNSFSSRPKRNEFLNGVAIYRDHFIFVTDDTTLRKMSVTGQEIKHVNVISYSPLKRLVDPRDVAVNDSTRQVFVTDYGDNCIQVFSIDLVPSTTIRRHGILSGLLKKPYGITIDSKGCLYVSLVGENRVVKLDSAGWLQASFGSDEQSTDSAPGKLSVPLSVAISHGYLYVSEAKSKRVSVFNIATQKFICFVGESYVTTPAGIATDKHGNLYVCDGRNGLLKF